MKQPKDFIFLFLKGVAMGSADVVPGVSGGTIAFITGIYDDLLNSIRSINGEALKLLFTGKIAAFWKYINGTFLLTLFLGIAAALVTLAKIISFLLAEYPVQVWAFFFGLILISAFLVSRELRDFNTGVVVAFLGGAAIAYYVTVATPATTPEALWFVFLSGMVAICAMILPGISGSFILLLMGKYAFVLGAVNDREITIIAVFALGALVGILAFSHVIGWLLEQYHNTAIGLLTGFMIGSLNKIWPWKYVVSTRINSKGEEVPFLTRNVMPDGYVEGDPVVIQAILCAGVGISLVYGLDWLGRKYQVKKDYV